MLKEKVRLKKKRRGKSGAGEMGIRLKNVRGPSARVLFFFLLADSGIFTLRNEAHMFLWEPVHAACKIRQLKEKNYRV